MSTALFLVLPIMQYQNLGADLPKNNRVHQVAMEVPMPERKKRPPPERKQEKPKPRTEAQAPKQIARQRLSMDLGVGGGGGVALAGSGSGEEQLVYEEGETDMDATPVRQVAPKYPEEARRAGVSGEVRALLTIDEQGNVVDVRILETPGDYGFDRAVREAVSQWKYRPAEVNGIAVRQKVEQPFRF